MHKDTEDTELDYSRMADYAYEVQRIIGLIGCYWALKGWARKRAQARAERAAINAALDEVILGAEAPGA